MTSDSATLPFRAGPHRVALLATAFTFPLLFVGGSVTSFGVGMAVPDWPTTFGINMFLYHFWNAPFGVRLEHSHRLYGAAVGMATIVLTTWLLLTDRRRFMKVLGVVALLAVIVQGVMGGLRVERISTTLAAVHGIFGQAFFALMVALCVLTGRIWHDAGVRRPDPARVRLVATVLLGLILTQVVVGAWFRHFGTTPALCSHIGLAVAVLGVAGGMFVGVARRKAELPLLWPSTLALGLGVCLQVLLGVAALWMVWPIGGNPRTPTLWQALIRTGHQTNGALLLGATVVLILRVYRHLVASSKHEQDSNSSIRPELVLRPMEVVA